MSIVVDSSVLGVNSTVDDVNGRPVIELQCCGENYVSSIDTRAATTVYNYIFFKQMTD